MSRRHALLVFTRSPEAEARAKGFGAREAAPLFRAFLESWIRLARETDTDVILACPPSCRGRLERSGVAPEAIFLTQTRAPFGERVAAACRETVALGFDTVAVVGADAPAIEPAELRVAFEAAETGAVALGPAADGGVYLIAASARDADLGRSLRLRDGRALARLLAEIAGRGRGVTLLPPREEVDSAQDAARMRRLGAAEPRWEPYRFLLALSLLARSAPRRRERRPGAAGEPRREPSRGPPVAS